MCKHHARYVRPHVCDSAHGCYTEPRNIRCWRCASSMKSKVIKHIVFYPTGFGFTSAITLHVRILHINNQAGSIRQCSDCKSMVLQLDACHRRDNTQHNLPASLKHRLFSKRVPNVINNITAYVYSTNIFITQRGPSMLGISLVDKPLSARIAMI